MQGKNEIGIVFCKWFDEVTEELCLFVMEEVSCIMLGLEKQVCNNLLYPYSWAY